MRLRGRRASIASERLRSLTPVSANPFAAAASFYINPENPAKAEADSLRSTDPDRAAQFDKIGNNPVAIWAGDWIPIGTEAAWVDERMTKIQAAGALGVFILYNIPLRDLGSHSSGGAADANAYRTWIKNIITGCAGRHAAIILEPDALPHLTSMTDPQRAERVTLLSEAVANLSTAGLTVYIDAGHSAWHPAATTAQLLEECNVAGARGFALNVSNFRLTNESETYGQLVVDALTSTNKYFVIDTSRNGLGPDPSNEWCNPPDRALGEKPSATTATTNCDVYYWLKAPGESDGTCNGGPPSGSWWADYGYGLASRATWGEPAPTEVKVQNISDDFTVLDPNKFPGSYGYSIVSGRVQIAPDVTYPRVSTGTDSTAKRYSLAESFAHIEVPIIPNIGSGTTGAFLRLEAPAGTGANSIEIGWQNGRMIFRELINGAYNDTSIVYAATSHRWWRLRHTSSTVYWETSPDKVTWTIQRQKTPDPAIDITKVAVALVSGYYGTETNPGVAEFDNLNL